MSASASTQTSAVAKPCSSGSTASAIAAPASTSAQCSHRTQRIDAVVGEHHAQALERARARAGDHHALARRELEPQLLGDRIEQIDIRARPLGREVARAPAAEIERGVGGAGRSAPRTATRSNRSRPSSRSLSACSLR